MKDQPRGEETAMTMSERDVREFECERCGAAETCNECTTGNCQRHPPDLCTDCWDTLAVGPHAGALARRLQ
jgi:hypothetical protein